MAIISTPWIPKSQIKSVLMSCMESEGDKTLENNGIKVIKTQPSPRLANPVSHHPDMLFLHLKENICVVNDKNHPFVSSLKNIGFSVIEAKNSYSERYPKDIGLNCVILNDMVIGNIDHIDDVVKEHLQNYQFINVSQGYTKCSICIADEHSLITEDESIYKTLKNQFDILKIESNSVELKGYNYGFFGGCTGLIDKNVMAINGELKYHKSCRQIISFLRYRNIDILELKRGNLVDIGSIIPLEE